MDVLTPRRAAYFLQYRLCGRKRSGDDRAHVVVFIFAQAAAEDDLSIPLRQCLVLCVQCAVFFVVYRVVWLVAGVPFGAVLPADDGFRQIAALLVLFKGKPLGLAKQLKVAI